MSDIQWSLLGPPVDIPGAIQQGYQTGRALRTQREQDSALHALSTNPDDAAAQNALMAVNPELAIHYQQASLARQDAARKTQARNASSNVIRAFGPSASPDAPSAFATTAPVAPSFPPAQQNAPALPPPVDASLAGLGGSPAPSMPIPAVGQPSAPQGAPAAPQSVLDPSHPVTQAVGAAVAAQRISPTDAVAELAKYADPEQVQQVLGTIKSMDAMRLSKLSEANDALGVAAQTLLLIPDDPNHEARRQALVAQADQLTQHGITPDQLASADLSDAALHGRIGQAVGVKGLIDIAQKDREASHQDAVLAETALHDRATERSAMVKDVAPGGSVVDFGDGSGTPTVVGGAPAASGSGHSAVALDGNNPGGINDGAFAKSQPGYQGANGRFAKFSTLQDGINAQTALLRSYVARGYDTPAKIAERWAPAADGNNPTAYAANVARQMGIGVNDKIAPAQIAAFQHAQAMQENSMYGQRTAAAAPHGGRVLFTAPEKPPTAPAGYRYKSDGSLEAIPGGPAEGVVLSDDTLRGMAEQYLAGDKSVLQNLGRGTQGAANVVRMRNEISQQARERGMTGREVAAQIAEFSGLVAGERTLGNRSANIEMASDEASRVIPLALQASQAIPRNGFLPFSKLEQAVQHGTNNTDYRRLYAATQAVINVYARAISPTGNPTVNDKEHARHLLDAAYDPQSYAAVLGQMQKEIGAARQAPADVRASFRDAVTGPQRSGPAESGNIPTLTPEQARAAPPGTLFHTTDGRTMRKH